MPRFVVFQSETEARSALEKIKSSVLGGKPVRARLKTESLIRRYKGGNDLAYIIRTPSSSNNSSPTYRAPPPQLVIEDSNTNSANSGNMPQQQTPQPYFYPPIIPMVSPTVSPNQVPGSPQFSGMYYVYSPHGYIPNPMYMGGVWPAPFMVQPSPKVNGPPNQQNRTNKPKQKSPRNASNQQYIRPQNQSRSFKNPPTSQPEAPIPPNQTPSSNENLDEEVTDVRKDQYPENNGKKKVFKKKKERTSESPGILWPVGILFH